MSVKSCAFFGHRQMNVDRYRDNLYKIITDLIENKGVTQFYSGFRGDFDIYCCAMVHGLRERYPQIKSTMVLSYIPEALNESGNAFELPEYFDDSVYLLERKVPERLAIIETNKRIADIADYIVAGVTYHGGGAYAACEYAYKRKKTVISVTGEWSL